VVTGKFMLDLGSPSPPERVRPLAPPCEGSGQTLRWLLAGAWGRRALLGEPRGQRARAAGPLWIAPDELPKKALEIEMERTRW